MAHFLGAKGAGKLISAVTSNPSALALFLTAAAANGSLFYEARARAASRTCTGSSTRDSRSRATPRWPLGSRPLFSDRGNSAIVPAVNSLWSLAGSAASGETLDLFSDSPRASWPNCSRAKRA